MPGVNLNQAAEVPFNTWVDVRCAYRPKALFRDFIVVNFGLEYYERVIASPIPFVFPFIYERFKVLIMMLY